MDRKKIKEVPKSNITPKSNYNSEQEFDINTFLNTSGTTAEVVDNLPRAIKTMPLNAFALNTSARNNSLLSLSGVFFLTADLILILYFAIGSRSNWITLEQSELCNYIHLLCAPLVLPMIYFMRNPNYLVVVLKDLNLM